MPLMVAVCLSGRQLRDHRWGWDLTMWRSLTEVVAANPPARANACDSSASIAGAERPPFALKEARNCLRSTRPHCSLNPDYLSPVTVTDVSVLRPAAAI